MADSSAVQDGRANPFPDGIGQQHLEPGRGARRHSSTLSLLLLAGLLALAFSGVLGGGPNIRKSAENGRAAITYDGPRFIRNGMLFEADAIVRANQPIGKLVLAVTPSLINDMTMNTMEPAAGQETYEDGAFRFTYGKLDKGDTFNAKFDFQINPSILGGNAGHIAVYDDQTLLIDLPVAITVFP